MKSTLRHAFEAEMAAAAGHVSARRWDAAFHHLERAHILGQKHTLPHARSHLWMLRVGLHRGDAREVLGQVTRTLAALLFSRIWVPAGNTGGANVNPLKPMPIPEDLRALLVE